MYYWTSRAAPARPSVDYLACTCNMNDISKVPCRVKNRLVALSRSTVTLHVLCSVVLSRYFCSAVSRNSKQLGERCISGAHPHATIPPACGEQAVSSAHHCIQLPWRQLSGRDAVKLPLWPISPSAGTRLIVTKAVMPHAQSTLMTRLCVFHPLSILQSAPCCQEVPTPERCHLALACSCSDGFDSDGMLCLCQGMASDVPLPTSTPDHTPDDHQLLSTTRNAVLC